MKQRSGYSTIQIALHWAIAVLILFNYLYSEGMEDALDARLEGTPLENIGINPSVHVWVGVTVLVLCLIRLGLRLRRGVPEAGGTGAMQLAAIWGHRLLYLLMILVPALGGITWFGRFDPTGELHVLAANALMIVAGGHAVMAIYHQFVVRDGLLTRMTRPES